MSEIIKFEFVLRLENNIICQRFFDVPKFNPKTLSSVQLYETIKYICSDIVNDIKIKNADHLMENKNFFQSLDYVDNEKDSEDYQLQIKLNDEIVNQRCFPSKYFHRKVRNSVDIRPKLKGMLNELTTVLSLRTKYIDTTYLTSDLKQTFESINRTNYPQYTH